ncbi:hypothetical protein BC628DRAFT_76366 [Trametes gibbosa]|nr:hypothetical protein BC628DRAFT_76366 [Trametes gibbosa]
MLPGECRNPFKFQTAGSSITYQNLDGVPAPIVPAEMLLYHPQSSRARAHRRTSWSCARYTLTCATPCRTIPSTQASVADCTSPRHVSYRFSPFCVDMPCARTPRKHVARWRNPRRRSPALARTFQCGCTTHAYATVSSRTECCSKSSDSRGLRHESHGAYPSSVLRRDCLRRKIPTFAASFAGSSFAAESM